MAAYTTMTFEEMVASGAEIYPAATPDELKATIEDWFFDRYVFNNDDFPRYFSRELQKDLGRYDRLLRVQPDIMDLDYMVEEYQERRREHAAQTTDSRTGSKGTEYGKTTGTANNDAHTGTVKTEHTQAEDNNYDNEQETEQQTYGKTQESTRTTTPGVVDTTETLLKQGTKDGHKEMQKVLPMSVSYSGTAAGTLPELSWENGSSQGQTEDTHEITGDDPDVVKVSRTGQDIEKNEQSDGGSDGRTISRKTGQARNFEDLTTYDEGNNGSSTITEGGKDTESTTETGSGSESGEETEIITGRHGEPAEILARAVEYIEETNAWEWLQTKLEPYFIGVFDI